MKQYEGIPRGGGQTTRTQSTRSGRPAERSSAGSGRQARKASGGRASRRGASPKDGRRRSIAMICAVAAAIVIIAVAIVLIVKPAYDKNIYVLKYEDIILKYAEKYELDPYLVAAMIYTESSYRPEAVSEAGARGLMQIMPDTGEWISGKLDIEDYDVEMLFDPDINIEMGCWYLSFLMNRFEGVRDTVCAAYNTGHGRVERWLQDPAYSEDGKTLQQMPNDDVKTYVERVNDHYEIYSTLYELR